MTGTSMNLGGRTVTLHHQGGYLLCVEADGDKVRLSPSELAECEAFLGQQLTTDELLIDIMRLIVQLANQGLIVRNNIDIGDGLGANGYLSMRVFRDYESFTAWMSEPYVFSDYLFSAVCIGTANIAGLQDLRTQLQNLMRETTPCTKHS